MSALTTAQICALLLGGAAVGSVGTVAVKERPAISRKKAVAAKPVKPRPAIKRNTLTLPAREPVCIMEMPLVGSPFALDTAPLPSLSGGAGVWLEQRSPDGGVWITPNPTPPTFPPAVPEPGVWLQMLAGFGIIAISIRRRRPFSWAETCPPLGMTARPAPLGVNAGGLPAKADISSGEGVKCGHLQKGSDHVTT